MLRHCVVTVLVVVVGCGKPEAGSVVQAGGANETAMVRTVIDSVNTVLSAALMNGDSITATSLYDPEGMTMPHGMNAAKGHAEILKGFGGFLSALKVSNMKLEISDVVVSGNLAVETGRYQWTVTPKGGKPTTDKGKYVVAWRRQADGSWKLFRDIFNNDAPETPAK